MVTFLTWLAFGLALGYYFQSSFSFNKRLNALEDRLNLLLKEPLQEDKSEAGPYRTPGKACYEPSLDDDHVAEASAPEPVVMRDTLPIPPLAQRYLDGAKSLEEKAIEEDVSGFSIMGDKYRREAEDCRKKAQKIIDASTVNTATAPQANHTVVLPG